MDSTDTLTAELQSIRLRRLLKEKFSRYTVDHLHGISPEEFRQKLEALIGSVDTEAEGYSPEELEQQRDLSIKFFWGHDHDFGTFQLEGRMKDRHHYMLEHFVDAFPVELSDFDGAEVFDIGCWTGGTALTLASLGARVLSIEEVKRYAATTRFLAKSFGIEDRITVEDRSLYRCGVPELKERFDIVYFPGVIYHLSDPLIALRILYNTLKIGGQILVESAGIDHPEPFCRFDGSQIYLSGNKSELNRGGWNWFMPSPSAVERMMREAGFEEVQAFWHPVYHRVYAYGRKVRQVGICRAGLSVPEIP